MRKTQAGHLSYGQPAVIVGWIDDQRHSVVDLAGHVIRRAGDYGKSLNPLAAPRGLPALPEAAKRKRAIVLEADEEGLFATRPLRKIRWWGSGNGVHARRPETRTP
jgi:hypothetical protein